MFQYVVYTHRMAFMYKVDHRGEISSIQRGEKWKDILQSTVIRLGRRVARVGGVERTKERMTDANDCRVFST